MSKRVLIIEDDQFFRELITKKLSDSGFEISMAVNGEDGLQKAKREKPGLIFLDILLPKMDGFEVLSEVKLDKETANIPVIILSNFGQSEDIEKGLKLGAVDYLIKAQIDLDEIVEKMKKYLN